MKMRFLTICLSFVLIFSMLPAAHTVGAASENNICYTIWRADPDNLSVEPGESVKAPMAAEAVYSPRFDVVKKNDSGSYYRTEMTVTGRGGDDFNTVLISGLDNNMRGYGWLEDITVLKAIKPFMNVSFEYRVNVLQGSVPPDGRIYLKAAHSYNGAATALCSVGMANASEWKSYSVDLNGNDFNNWYSGFLGLNIYSYSGGLNGIYLIDLRNFRVSLNSDDEASINSALEEAGSLWKFDDIVQSDPKFTSHNSIWYASPERLGAQNGQNVTGYVLNSYLPAMYDTVAVNGSEGSYYRTVMNVNGKGGNECNAVLKSGLDFNSEGYGWLESRALLNALAPYMYISFEYRFTSTEELPDDAYIYFGGATAYGKVCSFGSVKGAASEWTEYTLSPINGKFTGSWYSGFFTFNIYSYSGGFSGSQTVDLRNIRIELRDCDRLAINDSLSSVSGISWLENFSLNVVKDRDESGSYSYCNILINSLPNTAHDANDDGKADVLDIIRIKKHTSGKQWLSDIIIKRLDINGDDKVTGLELAAAEKTILNREISPYENDPIKVSVAVNHPGVAEMDAYYELEVTDANGAQISPEDVIVATDSTAVAVDGYTLTVPYSVRASDETLTVTVTSRTDAAVFGRYDFEFVKYTEEPTLEDDFNTLNTDIWSVFYGDGEYKIEDGSLIYTSQIGQTVGLSTKNKFEQAYGSFSARIKMPDKALVNGAFWLYSNTGKIYRRNPLNPSISGGEIDIVEYFPTWTGGAKWSATVHWYGSAAGHHRYSGNDQLNAGTDLGNDYHIYSAVWMKDAIYFYLDGKLYWIYNGEGISDHSDGMQIILSLHGNSEDSSWGGDFNADDFPDSMKTDWLRVYGLSE